VRQGCFLSPDLFLLYIDIIMRYIKEMEGIRVDSVNINNLRYADDIALLADGEQKLQELIVNVVVEESARKGLEIIRMKSYVLVFSKNLTVTCSIMVNGTALEKVDRFT